MLRVYYETDGEGILHFYIGPKDDPDTPGQEITCEEAQAIASIETAQALHILAGKPTRNGNV